MRKIKKITIKTTSGYCPYDYVYEDKMTITSNSMSYVNKPMSQNSFYSLAKWTYKSESNSFRTWFEGIQEKYEHCLSNYPLDSFITDVGTIVFTILYENCEKAENDFPFTGEFNEMLKHIARMVPEAEDQPVMLRSI